MTENKMPNTYLSFKIYDPVRALVCEDCCSEISGCSQSFEEIFEWGRLVLESLLCVAKTIGGFILLVHALGIWLFPPNEIDPEEEAYERAKRVDLALTVDQQAQIRKDFYYDASVYEGDEMATQLSLATRIAELKEALGNADCDPGLIDIELRKTRQDQISHAEHCWHKANARISREIKGYVDTLGDLRAEWDYYKHREKAAKRQWESSFWQDKRLYIESQIDRTEGKLAEARTHFAIVG